METEEIVELLSSAVRLDITRDKRRELLRSLAKGARNSAPRTSSPGPGVAGSASRSVAALALSAAWAVATAPSGRFSEEVRDLIRKAAQTALRWGVLVDQSGNTPTSLSIVERRNVPGGDWSVFYGDTSVGAAVDKPAARLGAQSFASFIGLERGAVKPVRGLRASPQPLGGA